MMKIVSNSDGDDFDIFESFCKDIIQLTIIYNQTDISKCVSL